MARAHWMSNAVKVIIVAVNLVATFLTLFTGLRENPVVLFATGKYDYARTRFIDGDVNYDNMRYDTLRQDAMINLTDVGSNYRFIEGPLRNNASVNADRSICMRVNTMNVSLMIGRYDDFWGTGTRRLTRFAYSISAPNCDVINLQPEWVESCNTTHGSMSACHEYILDNFDALRDDLEVQAYTAVENGLKGAPYLRCTGRPEEAFEFKTDWMLQHSYWSGGSYHVELQTSKCTASPAAHSSNWKSRLFQVTPADDASSFMVAVHGGGWFSKAVSVVYGIVSIFLIATGILTAIMQSAAVQYIPTKLRFVKEFRLLRWVFPSMNVATIVTEDENTIIRLKGKVLMASDLWINHWLYMTLSILDAIVHIRTTYVVYGYGTWYLLRKITFENFIFCCGALTRISWLMCFVHTVQRLALKLMVRSLRKFRVIKPAWRHKMEWYVDAASLFMSYKLYSVILGLLLYMFVAGRGSVTFMVKMVPFKVPTYGGLPSYASFWRSEIMCDFVVLLSFLTLIGWGIGSLMLLTKYKLVASNSVVRLLQQRYVFVGWDAFVAFSALGINPFQPSLVHQGSAMVSCSLGALVQQMYQSGPSGWVTLAGDYLFESGGFTREPVQFRYPTRRAMQMGLLASSKFQSGNSTAAKARYAVSNEAAGLGNPTTDKSTVGDAPADDEARLQANKEFHGLFERRLRLFAESSYGTLLLVDTNAPGKYGKAEDGAMEYTVRDALSYMGIHDIKHVLGNKKHLTIG